MSSLGDLLSAHLESSKQTQNKVSENSEQTAQSNSKQKEQAKINHLVSNSTETSSSSPNHKVFPERIEKIDFDADAKSNASSFDDYVAELLDPDDRPKNVWHVIEAPKGDSNEATERSEGPSPPAGNDPRDETSFDKYDGDSKHSSMDMSPANLNDYGDRLNQIATELAHTQPQINSKSGGPHHDHESYEQVDKSSSPAHQRREKARDHRYGHDAGVDYEKNKDRERDRDRDLKRVRDKEREHSRGRDRESKRFREKDREHSRGADRDSKRVREKDRGHSKGSDRDREQSKDRGRHGDRHDRDERRRRSHSRRDRTPTDKGSSEWAHLTHSSSQSMSHSSNYQGFPNSYRVYVGGLHVHLTEEMLRSVFQPFGPITRIELMKDRTTNVSRGYAFITYANIKDGQKAVESLDGFELAGKSLRVSKSTDKNERHNN